MATLTERATETRENLLAAAEHVLRQRGYGGLSTRAVADVAQMPLSQIHYHFGSKEALLLDVLAHQNEALLGRQAAMFGEDVPLSRRWDRACDYLEEDLASGYVRVLQELIAAGWSNPAIAAAVRAQLEGWRHLLSAVAAEAAARRGGLGPFTAEEVAHVVGALFLGAESLLLLEGRERAGAVLTGLRAVGRLIAAWEDGGA